MAATTSTGPAPLARGFDLHNIEWGNVLGIAIAHFGSILALFPMFFSWSAVVVLAVLFYCCGSLGMCVGYHRLLTHRSFQTFKPVEYLLTILGMLNMQGGPLRWVGTHRLHHKESDGPQDPHSPQHGFTWSHILWCMIKRPDGRDPLSASKDLQRDKALVAIDRLYVLWQLILAAILFGLGWWWLGSWAGGVGFVVWGVCVRTVISYHATWFVNSAAHTWGYRNFNTADGSRNNWWVALLSFGEGWHNNHHAQQRSAAHGMRWWEIDVTYWTIRAMELVGLARRVVRPDLSAMRR